MEAIVERCCGLDVHQRVVLACLIIGKVGEKPRKKIGRYGTTTRELPGRKTDVKDCEWIGDRLRPGLIAKSFVPPKPVRELRDLTRYRRKLAAAGATERNRLLKLLETANNKLGAGVASDVFGVSGRLMHAIAVPRRGEGLTCDCPALARAHRRGDPSSIHGSFNARRADPM
jgi:transposase